MAWFNRNKQNEVLPEEVQDYYKAEQRDRVGIAWLFAVGAFLLTVAVVVALFFAGRWAYQALFTDTDDTNGETSSEQIELDEDEDLPGPRDDDETGEENNDADTDSDAPITDEATDSEADTEDSEETVESSERAPQLPRTGPSDNL